MWVEEVEPDHHAALQSYCQHQQPTATAAGMPTIPGTNIQRALCTARWDPGQRTSGPTVDCHLLGEVGGQGQGEGR